MNETPANLVLKVWQFTPRNIRGGIQIVLPTKSYPFGSWIYHGDSILSTLPNNGYLVYCPSEGWTNLNADSGYTVMCLIGLNPFDPASGSNSLIVCGGSIEYSWEVAGSTQQLGLAGYRNVLARLGLRTPPGAGRIGF